MQKTSNISTRAITSTDTFQPEVSSQIVVAACLLLVNPKNNLIVATTRRNSAHLGLPGGKADPGESPLNTAMRETKEETGIVLPNKPQTLHIDIVRIDPKTGLQVAANSKKKNLKEFKTFCFFSFYENDIPGGTEEQINALWISPEEFLQKSAFKIYDANVLKAFAQMPPL